MRTIVVMFFFCLSLAPPLSAQNESGTSQPREQKFSAVNPVFFNYREDDVFILPPEKFEYGNHIIPPDPVTYPWEARLENGMPNVVKTPDGHFTIYVKKGSTIRISFLGLESHILTANIAGNFDIVLKDNSKVVIASGVQLDVKNSTLGADSSSVITGDGTLDLAGMTVNSVLDHLNNLSTSSGVSTITSSSTIKNSVTVADGTTLNFAGGSIGNAAYVNGTLNITQDTLSPTVVFDENGGTLDINNGKTLTITKNITVNGNDVLKGTGTLFLDGNSSGIFAMNSAFGGTIKIGSGTAYIQTNASIGAIGFADNTGGILDIADNNILTVGTIVTDGMNKITGNGTLNLTGQGSSFKAPIDNLGTLMVSNGGTAEFYNNINYNETQQRSDYPQSWGK